MATEITFEDLVRETKGKVQPEGSDVPKVVNNPSPQPEAIPYLDKIDKWFDKGIQALQHFENISNNLIKIKGEIIPEAKKGTAVGDMENVLKGMKEKKEGNP